MALNPKDMGEEVVIPKTSVASATAPPNEVTVQFKRWHQVGPAAYQRGQQAGFQPHEAAPLVARGIVVVVHDRAKMPAGPPMITK